MKQIDCYVVNPKNELEENIMKKISKVTVGIIAIFFLIATSAIAAETIRYNGSSTLLMTVIKPLSDAFTKKTGVTFNLKGKTTWYGLDKLIAGECDICGAGSNKIDKYQAKVGGALKVYKFAQEGIAIAVNSMNPIENISMSQLADIMTGKITDWDAVDWAQGKKIFVISCAKGTSHYKTFSKKVLNGVPFKTRTVYAKINPLVPKQIARFPGTIGYVGLGLVQGKTGVKIISLDGYMPTQKSVDSGEYPLRKSYFLITNGKPTGKVKEFIEFCMSPEGQNIIATAGMLKIEK